MVEQTFTLTNGENGRNYTAAEAEKWLIYVLSDPERAK
jgi:hypothetical protein